MNARGGRSIYLSIYLFFLSIYLSIYLSIISLAVPVSDRTGEKAAGSCRGAHLTERINQMVLESQLAHKIVDLLFLLPIKTIS